MERSVGSGGVLKKKTSSGCLIVKNKGDHKNLRGGVGGLAIDSSERKRHRLVARDSSTSEEDEPLELTRRERNDKRLENGSMDGKRSEIENRGYVRGNVVLGIGCERKSRFSYDFDEYDEVDVKNMSNEHAKDPYRTVGRDNSVGNLNGFGVGSSNRDSFVNKQKKVPYADGSSGGRIKAVDYSGLRNKGFNFEEDEKHRPVSSSRFQYQKATDEPIRVQGKNGVLKVMVNKKKKLEMPSYYTKYDPVEVEKREGSSSEKVAKKGSMARFPVCNDLNPPENCGLFVAKNKKVKDEKHEVKAKKLKPSSSKCIDDKELDNVGTDTVLKMAPLDGQSFSSKKGMKKEEESPPLEKIIPVTGKDTSEIKAKRGGSTEKQMLREKIRGMLIDAGWTIDHRPRRNRDYLDAVYINPSGTAFWSIIKAYDALKKQLGEDRRKRKSDVGSPSFAPLSEDLISKLTRQTKKKKIDEAKNTKEDGLTKNSKKSAVRYDAESSDSDQNKENSCEKQNSKSQRRNCQELYEESEDDFSDVSPKRGSKKVASSSNILQGRTSKKIGRSTLLVRRFDHGGNSDSHGYIPYNGKRTLLAWLIDSGTATLSERVQYMNRKRTQGLLEGWITKEGIHCGCCSKILTVSKFELHAGSRLRQPFQNIFMESGQSLLQCQVDAWNRQPESSRRDFYSVDVDGGESDDDTCGICGDGGALICCDSCPSTFHQICLDIQMLPSGDWHCPNCTCKYCGLRAGTFARVNDDEADELIKCTFCERRYHESCCKKAVHVSSSVSSFCGIRCQELYNHLQKMIGVKHELEGGFSWSLIQRSDISDNSDHGYPLMVECNSKLAVALSVMDECFMPIIDRRSGINIVHNIVYNCGSNFNRLNYRGFYTVILECEDEIVAAASIRIHGALFAEMPFIGTREMYRRQGMCRRLLSSLETELGSLNIGHLVIPSISEHRNTWTTAFGFNPLEDALRKEIKSTNMLVFPGTNMLQKQLANRETSHGKEASQLQAAKAQDKSSIISSLECNHSANENYEVFHDTAALDRVDSLGASSPEAVALLNGKAIASDSDSALSSKRFAVINTDVETKQEQLSPSSEGARTAPAKDDLSTQRNGNAMPAANIENHEIPLKISGDSLSSEAETNAESGQVPDDRADDVPMKMKAYEAAESDGVLRNGDSVETPADSTFGTPELGLEDEEPIAPTLTTVASEEEILVPEPNLNHPHQDSSLNPDVAVGDNDVLSGSAASCSLKNVELDCVRETEDSAPDVSDRDAAKRVNVTSEQPPKF